IARVARERAHSHTPKAGECHFYGHPARRGRDRGAQVQPQRPPLALFFIIKLVLYKGAARREQRSIAPGYERPFTTWAKRARVAVSQSIDRYRSFLDYFAMQYLLCCAAEAPWSRVIHYALRYAHSAMSQHCFELLVWTPRRLG